MTSRRDAISRRGFLAGGARALLLAPLAAGAWVQAACGSGEQGGSPEASAGSGQASDAGSGAAEPAPSGGGARPRAGGSDAARLVTEVPAMEPLVEQLQYVNESPKPDQNCANCLFYTARGGDRGQCQLFAQGRVAAGGWCASWSAKTS